MGHGNPRQNIVSLAALLPLQVHERCRNSIRKLEVPRGMLQYADLLEFRAQTARGVSGDPQLKIALQSD